MSILSRVVELFQRLRTVFENDYGGLCESAYFKDQSLAKIKVIDCILLNGHNHRYTKLGLQSFLMTLKAEHHADSAIISDHGYFVRAFNEYVQLLQNEISLSMIAGVPVTFVYLRTYGS